MKRRRIRGTFLTLAPVAALLLLSAGSAVADDAATVKSQVLEARIPTTIPAQSLADAVDRLCLLADFNCIPEGVYLQDRTAPEVPEGTKLGDAFTRVLSPNGLTYSLNGNTLSFTRIPRKEIATEGNRARQAKNDAPKVVLVNGQRILDSDRARTPDDALPNVTLDRRDIQRYGATTIGKLLQQLPISAPNLREPGLGGNSSAVNLRGFGTNQTQILIDGRAVASSSVLGTPEQPDFNAIPTSAIEKIVIVPTNASGIYGAGATGGVINIIMRRDYSGLESVVTYGDTLAGGGASERVSVNGGTSLANKRTTVQFTADYSHSDPLQVRNREFLVLRGRSARLVNNPQAILGAADPPLGARTNIRSLSGSDLTLKSTGTNLGSPITHVPAEYAGIASDGGLALSTNAGQYNLDLAQTAEQNGGEGATLANGAATGYFNLTVRHDFNVRKKVFAELSLNWNRGYLPTNVGFGPITLTADAANNPFQQDIRITTPGLGLDGVLVVELLSPRALFGFEYTFNNDWHLLADYTFSGSRYFAKVPGGLSAEGYAEIGSGSLDVLRDTSPYAADFAPYRTFDSTYSAAYTFLNVGRLRLDGTLEGLPAGAVNFTVGLEQRLDTVQAQVFRSALVLSPSPSRQQRATSVAGEAKVPLVTESAGIVGIHDLSLELAARYDVFRTLDADFTATGLARATNKVHAVSPTLGVRYEPSRALQFRASYGTGFVPPAVDQLVPNPPITIFGPILPVTDPKRGNTPLGTFILESGGNANLRPERSRSVSAGAIWQPRGNDHIRVSVDWTRIRKRDEIGVLPLIQQTLDDEDTLPNTLTRGPVPPGDPYAVGPITVFNARRMNMATRLMETLDLTFDAENLNVAGGQLRFFAMAGHQLRARSQITRQGPAIDDLGLVRAPRWNARLGTSWSFRAFECGWVARSFSGYWLNDTHQMEANQGTARVAGQTYHDLFLRWESDARTGIAVQFGVTNVTNAPPPLDVTADSTGEAQYSPFADPKQASYYLSIRKQLGGKDKRSE